MLIILHIPYLCWHLSYVVIGAALAPVLNCGTLLWTLLAFFLGMGICAHCADELRGRPLKTQIPDWLLVQLCLWSLGGAIAIGLTVGIEETVWIWPCIIFGGFIVFAYNLEWFRGFFHTNFWFAFTWGAFPAITAYVAQTHTLSPVIVLVAVACLLYSMAQRKLSFQVRFFRRKVSELLGTYRVPDNPTWEQNFYLQKQDIIGPPEVALKLMTWTVVAAAIGLILMHI
ncbi:hypothetical protein ES703_87108 [subsurface metagenome]